MTECILEKLAVLVLAVVASLARWIACISNKNVNLDSYSHHKPDRRCILAEEAQCCGELLGGIPVEAAFLGEAGGRIPAAAAFLSCFGGTANKKSNWDSYWRHKTSRWRNLAEFG